MKLFTKENFFVFYCIIMMFFSIVILDLILRSDDMQRVRVNLRGGRPVQSRSVRGRKREDALFSPWGDKPDSLSDIEKDIIKKEKERRKKDLTQLEEW